MVKVMEGVRIDSEQFPHSWELAQKAKSIAIHFKFSIEDALQELMYLELINRRKKIKNMRGYLISSLYNNACTKYVRNKKRATLEKDVVVCFYGEFDRQALRDKIFVEELVTILSKVDEALSELVVRVSKHVDMSLLQIYRCYYASKCSQDEFYKRLAKLRRVAKDFAKQGWVAFDKVSELGKVA